MGNKKTYYYLKLRENFFDSDEIKLLEATENGYLYCNILLKLYLKSLKNEGRLVFRENIPYNLKMLATLTGHNIDVVEKAIRIFREFELIQILDSGEIYISDIQAFIGEGSTEADRKRLYRDKLDKLSNKVGHLSAICPTDVPQMSPIDRDRDRDKKNTMCDSSHEVENSDDLGTKKPSFEEGSYEDEFNYSDFEQIDNKPILKANKKLLNLAARIVLRHFNWCTRSRYRPVESNLSMIRSVLSSGVTIRDCYAVNSSKCNEWQNNVEMAKFLRPKTLYAAKNFEQYLGKIKTNRARQGEAK